jgi:hypothetical protein
MLRDTNSSCVSHPRTALDWKRRKWFSGVGDIRRVLLLTEQKINEGRKIWCEKEDFRPRKQG